MLFEEALSSVGGTDDESNMVRPSTPHKPTAASYRTMMEARPQVHFTDAEGPRFPLPQDQKLYRALTPKIRGCPMNTPS